MVFLFILIIFIIVLMFSKIRIQIENVKFASTLPEKLNNKYKIVLKLYILGVIPIVKIKITKNMLERLKVKQRIQKLERKLIENNSQFDKRFLKQMKLAKEKVKITIKNIDLKIEVGTENAGVTAIIVGIFSSIIGIFLSGKVKEEKNSRFEIIPKYLNQNLINVQFWGIFEIKTIHIINIIYILSKKGEDKNERTSNRRSYDYSYE